jgi:tetratricopeptide (TPR) repeat protein/thiamine kinase-like enzyme
VPSVEPRRPSDVAQTHPAAGAKALALRGDVALALTQARSAVKSHPKNARTLWDYGAIMIDAGILSGVGFVPEQIGAPPPGARRVTVGRGSDRGKRMIEAGLRALHEALELGAPAAVRIDAGRALLALGRRDDARALLSDAVARSPADAEAHALLATVLDRLGDYDTATVHHETAQAVWAASDPDGDALSTQQLDHLVRLAEALIDDGDPEEAEALIGPAADRSPAHGGAMRARVRAALDRGAPDMARPLALHAALTSEDPNTLRPLLARVAGSGVAPDGEMALLDAWIAEPDDADALLALARHLADTRDASLAEVALRRLIDGHENRADAWQLLAGILIRTQGADAARTAADKALAIAGDDADVRLGHAHLLERLGDQAGSLDALRDAAALGAETDAVSLAMADRAVETGRIDEALTVLRRLLIDTPDTIQALRRYVVCLTDSDAAAAVVWARRLIADEASEDGDKHLLAQALLECGRWTEAAKLRGRPAPPPTIRARIWDGGPVGADGLCLFHRGSDTPEQSLLGLAVASILAAGGTRVTTLIPDALRPAVAPLDGRVEMLSHGHRTTRRALKDRRFDAAYPLTLPMLAGGAAVRPVDGWLAQTENAAAKDVYVLRAKGGAVPWPPLGALSSTLRGPDGGTVRVVNAPAPHAAGAVLRKARAVVTDDPVTALIAIGLSRPTVLIEGAPLGWWWGRDGDACPWSERLTVVRRGGGMDADTLLDRIRAAVADGARPRGVGLRPRADLDDPAVDDALDRFRRSLGPLSGDAPLSCTLLEGGTRNHIVKVDAPAGPRVLRPGRFPPPRVGFFDKEVGNMNRAAAAGLAPTVHAADPVDGAFVIDFVNGEVMRSATLRRPENAVAAAKTYRRLHRLSGFTGEYDIFEKLAREVDTLLNADETAMADYEESLALIHRIAERLLDNAVPPTATHNDPLTRNFIRTDDAMMLIDWECSAHADPHWEVAAMAAQAGVRDDARRAYLSAYFGRDNHPAECRVHLFEAVCHFYWWVEGRAGAATGDDDPEDAVPWWRRFRRTVDDPAFARSMAAAKHYRYAPSDDV